MDVVPFSLFPSVFHHSGLIST